MDNQNVVFQMKTEEINLPYIVVGTLFAGFLFFRLTTYSDSFSALWPVFALLIGLLVYLYRVANAPKMKFYADGRITYGTDTFQASDYLGITTIINHDTGKISEQYYGVMPTRVVLIHKDKLKENLPIFEIPLIFHGLYQGAELHEIVHLKKQIAQATHLPIFEPCQGTILRDRLIPWQEKEDSDHLIVYQSRPREIILYSIVLALMASIMGFVVATLSNYNLLYIAAVVLISAALYSLLYKYRFAITTTTTAEMTLGNRSLSYGQQEIAYRDIQQVKIRDIHSQKYYAYSRLSITLSNGEKIKLCVSTPHVRDPQKLRSLLAAKLHNKLVDANRQRPHPPHSRGA